MKEFDIINKYFQNISTNIGDDCAILDISSYNNLLVTTDTLVENTHFLSDCPPDSIGYKALSVNLSDLAAMGAQPKWVTLALTLPQYDHKWLSEFTRGFKEVLNKFNINLIGGDTTKGPLSITITAMGVRNQANKILTRSGAKPSDGIFVTGSLGLPAYILDVLLNNKVNNIVDNIDNLINSKANKLYYPEAKVDIGLKLSDFASSCIDISDGLLSDLGHILEQSKVGADIYLDKLPIDIILKNNKLAKDKVFKYMLAGGDEYELLFTAPMEFKDKIINDPELNASYIGKINKNVENINLISSTDDKIEINLKDYQGWLNFE